MKFSSSFTLVMKTSSLQLPSLAGTLSIKSMLQSAPKHIIFYFKNSKISWEGLKLLCHHMVTKLVFFDTFTHKNYLNLVCHTLKVWILLISILFALKCPSTNVLAQSISSFGFFYTIQQISTSRTSL